MAKKNVAAVPASNKIKTSTGEKIFTVFNYTFFTILCLLMLYPFWHQFMVSLSDVKSTMAGGFFLYPKGFNLDTYESVFKQQKLLNGFVITIFVTVFGTVVGTFLTATTAYPLSKSRLRGGKVCMLIILFTMIFNAGMIPNYLLIRNLGMYNTIWALVLPLMVSAYNVIIMRSFFTSISPSMEEAAHIDGANDLRIFFSIILPLSKATIATIALFNAVMYWNDYLSSVLYSNTDTFWSLQQVLRNMLTNTAQAMQQAGVQIVGTNNTTATTIKAGSVVVATVPILIVYPFVQKYFVKGVMIGGVKG